MKYLILGGNGYLGSKIVSDLVQQGNDVICAIRTGSDISRLHKIAQNIEFISIENISTVLHEGKVDRVVNMVCNYSQQESDYEKVLNANLNFPLSVLNSCFINKVEYFVTVDTSLPSNLNMYSFAKSELNRFGEFYCSKHGMTFLSLQLEMFYGYDEPQNRFLPMIIRKMLNAEEVNTTLGTQRRDIIAVDDVVDAVNKILKSDLSGYQEISVGTGMAPTVSEIIDYIWEETGKRSIINKGAIPMRSMEPDCIANNDKLRDFSEWNPKPWKDGIKEMIKKISQGEKS